LGTSHWVIGADEDSYGYTALYSDEHMVSRVYRMSLDARLWKVRREALPRSIGALKEESKWTVGKSMPSGEKSEDDGKDNETRPWHDLRAIQPAVER
jgi:hypothetical protein